MRLSTLCLGLGAVTLFTLSTTLVSSVQAQEVQAPEEWLENIKLDQAVIFNKRRVGRRLNKRSSSEAVQQEQVDDLEDESEQPIIRLEKRVRGRPPRSELVLRATAYKSFVADQLVKAPANLRVIKEVTKKPAASRFEQQESKKKKIATTKTNKGKKAANKKQGKKQGKKQAGDKKKLEKRYTKKQVKKQTKKQSGTKKTSNKAKKSTRQQA
ncbi:hypothetical protein BGZ83_012128 [Gryganskiella cystojenkinii]|nr:hypothetical protein BGZ83_012128 [Gryganskiella cystojenkinii]